MRFLRFYIPVLIILHFFSADAAASGRTLVIASTGDAMDVVSLAVLREAYQHLGISVEGRDLPAARCLKESDAGRVDGEANRVRDIETEHPDLIRIPALVNIVEGVAFCCGTCPNINGWEDLEPYSLGIRLGIRISEEKTRGMPKVRSFPHFDKAFDLLVLNRLDFVLATRSEGAAQKLRTGNECIRPAEPPLEVIPLYHYLHKKNRDLVPRVTQVLQDMEKSGRICEIWQEHGKTEACP